jgi:lipopolysaccharide/colanic/teichoic acid biosynthesis glycosyltransferase
MQEFLDDKILSEYELMLKENNIEKYRQNLKKIFVTNQTAFIEEEIDLNTLFFLRKHLIDRSNSINIGDYYFGQLKTLENWRENRPYLKKSIFGFTLRLYYFFFLRVLPRLRLIYLTKSYFFSKNSRLISKAEIIGRFFYSGFDIVLIEKFNNNYFFVVKKISKPNIKSVSVGPIFKMKRIGKNGLLFNVYKIRTMHPYSEFMQGYMIKKFGYSNNGKLNNDFRMTNWARFFRKYWLDEIPQLINLFLGNMNLVGVRPVTEIYFQKIPGNHKQDRIKFKPGCIPPYLALDFNSDKESVLKAEMIYLKLKKKKPLKTDFVFFIKSIYSIVFLKRRSN